MLYNMLYNVLVKFVFTSPNWLINPFCHSVKFVVVCGGGIFLIFFFRSLYSFYPKKINDFQHGDDSQRSQPQNLQHVHSFFNDSAENELSKR